jgi:hypothetical protein
MRPDQALAAAALLVPLLLLVLPIPLHPPASSRGPPTVPPSAAPPVREERVGPATADARLRRATREAAEPLVLRAAAPHLIRARAGGPIDLSRWTVRALGDLFSDAELPTVKAQPRSRPRFSYYSAQPMNASGAAATASGVPQEPDHDVIFGVTLGRFARVVAGAEPLWGPAAGPGPEPNGDLVYFSGGVETLAPALRAELAPALGWAGLEAPTRCGSDGSRGRGGRSVRSHAPHAPPGAALGRGAPPSAGRSPARRLVRGRRFVPRLVPRLVRRQRAFELPRGRLKRSEEARGASDVGRVAGRQQSLDASERRPHAAAHAPRAVGGRGSGARRRHRRPPRPRRRGERERAGERAPPSCGDRAGGGQRGRSAGLPCGSRRRVGRKGRGQS